MALPKSQHIHESVDLEEAARFLGLTLPQLEQVLELGELAAVGHGADRRIRPSELTAYREQRRARRRRALDEIVAISEEAGMYDGEAELTQSDAWKQTR